MHNDILDDNDGVVDNETDRRSEAAQRHQVETLPNDPEKENRNRDSDRYDQTGDQRRGPVTEKEKQDGARKQKPNQNRVAHTGDAVANEFGLIVKRLQMNSRWQSLTELLDLASDSLGYRNRIAGGLSGYVEQH